MTVDHTHIRLSEADVRRLLADEILRKPFGIELSYRGERAYVVPRSRLEAWTDLPDTQRETWLLGAVISDVLAEDRYPEHGEILDGQSPGSRRENRSGGISISGFVEILFSRYYSV